MMFSAGILYILTSTVVSASRYDPTRSDNLAVYWGQGSLNESLATYCRNSGVNAIPIAFVDIFFGPGGKPGLDIDDPCKNDLFPGTSLPKCQPLAADIQACQAAGVIITISLGGGTGPGDMVSDAKGKAFADTIWETFLGGQSSTRPFGTAVLDGVDLDIEGGGHSGLAAFVKQLRTHTNGASKPYYVTGAPQCSFPDAWLGPVINAVGFDALYVQFYNNYCAVTTYPGTSWNFATWDDWAKTTSPNKNIKIFIGAPASEAAANSGSYVSAEKLGEIAKATRAKYSSFGGIMLWDAADAATNNNFDQQIKKALTAAGGGTGTTNTHQTTTSTPKNSTNTHQSTITSKSRTTTTTTSRTKSRTTTTTSKTETCTRKPTFTTSKTASSTPSIPTGGCANVAAWTSTLAYVGGSRVTYNDHIWQAKWWSEADAPTGPSGDWADLGTCSSLYSTAKTCAPRKTTALPARVTHGTTAQPTLTDTGEAKSHLRRREFRDL
ncbi:glycoside hydrolase [Mycena vitilis]|nr:glycoside hydrolase [Mycena vitilis]